MAQRLSGANDEQKLAELCTRSFKDQGVWFLNAFWEEHQQDKDKVWAYTHKMDSIFQADNPTKKDEEKKKLELLLMNSRRIAFWKRFQRP